MGPLHPGMFRNSKGHSNKKRSDQTDTLNTLPVGNDDSPRENLREMKATITTAVRSNERGVLYVITSVHLV